MPCYDGGLAQLEIESRETIRNAALNNTDEEIKGIYEMALEVQSATDKLKHYAEVLDKRNTMLAQCLCFLMNNMDTASIAEACIRNDDLKQWWEAHQKFDKKRKDG